MTIKINKQLETHEKVVEKSWAICSIVAPRFSGIIEVMYGDVVNTIFCITMMIFVKVLPRYPYDLLESITMLYIK